MSKPVDLRKKPEVSQVDQILLSITPIIIIAMIMILIVMFFVAFGHVFATEANHYEHMDKIVLFYGGRFL